MTGSVMKTVFPERTPLSLDIEGLGSVEVHVSS